MIFLQPIKGKPCARPDTSNKPLHKFRASKKPLELSEHHNQKPPTDRVVRLASERAVVVFTTSNCSMCHSVTSLLSNLGVNAAVHELDREPRGREMERELARMLGGRVHRRDQQGHGAAPHRRARAHAQESRRTLAVACRIENVAALFGQEYVCA
jgi:hypothetical protein